MDSYGKFMKHPKKRKKSKLQKTLEEGDLLFNLVLSAWFFLLGVVFSGAFKIFLPYKYAMLSIYSVISALAINLIFKIVDIYIVYTKEPINDKIHQKLTEKRKTKQTL